MRLIVRGNARKSAIGEVGFVHVGFPFGGWSAQRITQPIAAERSISGGVALMAQGAETAVDAMGFGIACPHAVVRFVSGCDRKRPGNGFGIRPARPSAALSSDAIRMLPYEVWPR